MLTPNVRAATSKGRGLADFIPDEQDRIPKGHQNRFGAVKELLGAGIDNRALWCPDPSRKAHDGAVEIRYPAAAGPGIHLPGLLGRAAAQLHEGLTAERRLNIGVLQQL